MRKMFLRQPSDLYLLLLLCGTFSLVLSPSCSLILKPLDASAQHDGDADGDIDIPADSDSQDAAPETAPDTDLEGVDADADDDDEVIEDTGVDGDVTFDGDIDEPVERVLDDLVVLYTFDEGRGATISDVSGHPPINLELENESSVTWTDEGLEMNIDELTMGRSKTAPERLLEACQRSNAITIEAWVEPEFLSDTGPGRIITLSVDGYNRNFTLAQGDDDPEEIWVFRLRTDEGGASGNHNGHPQLETHPGTTSLALTHIVFTHSEVSEMAQAYIDGVEVELTASNDRVNFSLGWPRTGGYSNWDPSYELAIGWELAMQSDARAWSGVYRLVAVYSRALSGTEVHQNYLAGP